MFFLKRVKATSLRDVTLTAVLLGSILNVVVQTKGRLSYHLCVECFSKLSFDSEVYTKSAAVDFVYTSESNESCEKHSTER